MEQFLRKTLRHEIIADSNSTFLDEIHLRYFILFIKNKLIVLSEIKHSGLDVEANIIQELGLHVFNCKEEGSELVDHVVKQIVQDHVSSNSLRALIKILIIFLDTFDPVICPVERKVLVDLVDQGFG